jgi:OmpA family/Flagella basal body rod protein
LDSGYYAACSALKAHVPALEFAANNIANISTTGYSAAQLDKRRAGQLRRRSRRRFCSMARCRRSRPTSAAYRRTACPPTCPSATPTMMSSPCFAPRWKKRWRERSPRATSEFAARPKAWSSACAKLDSLTAVRRIFAPVRCRLFRGWRKCCARLTPIFVFEGHTDNVPIHNSRYRSNWDLSTARATNTIRLLNTQYDFPPERLAASGYAEYRPITSSDDAAGGHRTGGWILWFRGNPSRSPTQPDIETGDSGMGGGLTMVLVTRPTSSGRGSRRRPAGGAPAPHKQFETLGLIVIVILILALVITRSWHLIAWRAR